MKRLTIGSVLVIAVGLLTTGASAQDRERPDGERRVQGQGQRRNAERGDRERGGQQERRERGQRGDGQREGGQRGAGGGDLLFRALDIDSDGTISAKEIENALAALMKLDKNKDGQLTRDELRPEAGRGGGGERRGQGGDRQPRGGGQRDRQRPDQEKE